jgi:pyridoxal phosphate enzyme (YggS family)
MTRSPLADRWKDLRDRVDVASSRRGRSLTDITVVAVTKTVPRPLVDEAYQCGLRYFGESRVQEASTKRLDVEGVRWHLIGHLQTNKIKQAVDIFDCVQTLDSFRLAQGLNQAAERRGRVLPCLVEVKVSKEPQKQGFLPDFLDDFLACAGEWPWLRLEGLMTIAPFFDDPEKTRPYFRRAKALFDKHHGSFRVDQPGAQPILSMGMSHDFEIAVEEGATMIRVGAALFGDRP